MSPAEACGPGGPADPLPFEPPFVATSDRQRGPALRIKRAIDVAVAAAVLLGTLPISAVVVAALKLTSPGPVLFLSTRVGRNGRLFTMYKFRSMVADADPAVHVRFVAEALKAGEDDADLFKLVKDDRITPVGRWIRRASVDELPQLLNVLRGDMSLVGPRPDVPYSVADYEPWQFRRFSVLPGMTGLWQVSGRSRLSLSSMLALDIEYVDGWSCWLDLKLLARTLPCLLRPSTAR